MNRDGFSLLVMGFTGKKALDFKLEYIDAFNKMEQTISRPRTHKEVIMSELALLEENERLQIENSKMKTRSDFVNIVFDSDKLLSGSKVCKLLNLSYGNQTLYKILREKGIFFKNGNEPKQSYVDRGYFRMKEIVVNDVIRTQTLFTQKGLAFIAKTLGVVTEPIKQVKTI
jgi:anti-repressor protein